MPRKPHPKRDPEAKSRLKGGAAADGESRHGRRSSAAMSAAGGPEGPKPSGLTAAGRGHLRQPTRCCAAGETLWACFEIKKGRQEPVAAVWAAAGDSILTLSLQRELCIHHWMPFPNFQGAPAARRTALFLDATLCIPVGSPPST